MGIFARIRERRLFQIVASYLAAGWILLEASDQFVDRGFLPAVVYEVLLIGYLIGLPAAMLVGWYHGEKGAQRAPRAEIAMLTVLGAMFLLFSSFTVRDYRAERVAIAAAQREAGTDLRKIAVLYFDDYTAGRENQHVADAFTEALITELSAVPTLQVVTRSGVSQFRNNEVARDSIGRALAVGTLVDGSVENAGDQLRITVRLFDAFSGSEFRSTTVEAPADDLLRAQEDLVTDVANLLRSWLGEEVRVRAGGQRIRNVEAWTLYQRAERARKDGESALHAHQSDAAASAFAQADSLAAGAALLAPEWPDPLVLRGTVAYRRARLAHDAHAARTLAETALTHAERALELQPNHAYALELRGTVRYLMYWSTREANPDAAAASLASARTDLERAVSLEPTLASAYSVLSHLLYREDISSAVLAARRAYEADAYLDVAPEVLYRLVTGNYDMENFDQLERWCTEGARRFPQDFRFTECQLLLGTTRQVEPDVARAWSLLAALDSLAPPALSAYQQAQGLVLVGGTIARAARTGADAAALSDSARAVLQRARDAANSEVDPRQELLPLTAYMYTLLGDEESAVALLRRYAAVNPHFSVEHHWWWRDMRGRPAMQDLIARH